MGEVYRAHLHGDDGFRTRFAIKRLLEDSKQHANYFLNEAVLGGQFVHQNLVRVFDYFKQGDSNYLVMELVDGIDLGHLTKNRKITVEMAVYVAAEALKGLDFAHNAAINGRPANFVHRDLSPDNILISCDAEVKVSDMGIAKTTIDSKQQTSEKGLLRGKIHYISPELLRGDEVDRRADIYAMGVVLYETLAGRKPIASSRSIEEWALAAVIGSVTPLREAAPHVPEALAVVVDKMLHHKREDRYATAAEVRAALLRAVPGAAIVDRELAETVKGATATNRRPTSPYVSRDELEAYKAEAPPEAGGVVISASDDQLTVRNRSDDALEANASPADEVDARHRPTVPVPVSSDRNAASRPVPARTATRWIAPLAIVGALGAAGALGAQLVKRSQTIVAPTAQSAPAAPPAATPPAPTVVAAAPTPEAAPSVAPTEVAEPASARVEAKKPRPAAPRAATSATATPATAAPAAPPPPAPAETKPAVTASAPGLLIVEASGARVTLDGIKIGEGPLKYEVSPGKHAVHVIYAKGAEQKYALEVKPGTPYKLAETAPSKSSTAQTPEELLRDAQEAYIKSRYQEAIETSRKVLALSKAEYDVSKASMLTAASLCKLGDLKGSKAAAKRVTHDNMIVFVTRECGQ